MQANIRDWSSTSTVKNTSFLLAITSDIKLYMTAAYHNDNNTALVEQIIYFVVFAQMLLDTQAVKTILLDIPSLGKQVLHRLLTYCNI